MPRRYWNRDGNRVGFLSGLLVANAGLALAQPPPSAPRAEPAAASVPSAAAQPAAAAFDMVLLEVHLNGHNLQQTAMLLRRPDGRLLASRSDLALWRLRPPDVPATPYEDAPYLPLDAIGQFSYRVDTATESLWLTSAVDNLLPSVLEVDDPRVAGAQRPTPGGFLNYDLSAQRAGGQGTLGAQLEFGAFAGGLVATTQLVNPTIGAHGRFIRLDSTVTMDRPGQLASLRAGDGVSRAGTWGRPVRFGGVQWASNFATQPEFVTFPLPSVSGASALPSTAQVFVNNALSYQHELEAGPFSVQGVPAVSGQGEIRMVVRDLLGREQVIVQPYYAARSLLRSGLDDFSYEAGMQRRNFTSASNDYQGWLLAATRRHGVNDQLTAEVHGELQAGSQNLGLAATLLWRNAGVFDVALAASHSGAGGGVLMTLGFERQAEHLSFGVRTQVASARFEQLGLEPGVPVPLRQSNAHLGWNDARFGSVGLGYVRIDNRGQPGSALVSVSVSRNLRPDWNLEVSGFKSLQGRNYALAFTLTHAFGPRSSASLAASRGADTGSAMLQFQQNLPAGPGVGYRVLAGRDASARVEGALTLQNDVGTYALEAARAGNIDAWRASASGAVALLGGQAFLARRLGDSFAVVRVPGTPGVQVYAENQPVARTDSSGAALVPGLRPYQKNRLSIEQADLPLDAQIGSLEAIAVPYYRSGYALVFPISKANGALLHVVTADGKPMPAGAVLHIAGRAETFPVAQDGLAYVAGLGAHNELSVVLGRAVCRFAVAYAEAASPQPDLGTFVCRGIAP